MIDLVVQYKQARKLTKAINIDHCNVHIEEERVVNEILSDLDYAIDWMRTGKQPNAYESGTTTQSAYNRRALLDMDLFPCLDIEPTHCRTISEEKKRAVSMIIQQLSERQLTCFLLHTAHMRTHNEIAEELGVGASTVQKHIERAKEKVREIAATIDTENIF